MKTKIFIFSFAAIILFSVSSAYNFVHAENSASKSEKVELKGYLEKPTSKSGGDPFEVFKDANFLSIYYLQDLSNISIEVLDEFGQGVYSNTVDPTSGGSLFIDISNWPARYYTLYFKDRSGNSIYGSFEIK